MGCLCLGTCLSCFHNKEGFPAKSRRIAFQTILVEFFKIFPSNTAKFKKEASIFDIRSNISKATFDARIQLINALCLCFHLPEANEEQLLRYVDELFTSILKSNSHALLFSAVLEGLAKNLPKTNRNRIRIETYYRKPIDALIALHHADMESTRPSLAHLIASLNLFMSVWYPLPSDKSILFAQPLEGDDMELNGYYSKRYDYLKDQDQGDTLFEELNQTEKLEVIKLAQIEPYTSQPVDFEFKIGVFEKNVAIAAQGVYIFKLSLLALHFSPFSLLFFLFFRRI
jgi:hypothetical protein